MSLTRDMAIMDAMQKNAVIDATRDSGMAGMRNSFFDAIRRSLRPNAPLLLAALEAAHPLAGAFATWHDGPAAWVALNALSAPATALGPETDYHEDHMTALRLKILPDGSSSDDFGKRVNDALIGGLWRARKAEVSSPCTNPQATERGWMRLVLEWVESLLWGVRDCSACNGRSGVC